eukprot:SAG22_NODE_77_length_22125_cov_46.140016_21_plen_280_part_00
MFIVYCLTRDNNCQTITLAAYLVADRIVFPPEIAGLPHARTEDLLYMPHSFFGCGYNKSLASIAPAEPPTGGQPAPSDDAAPAAASGHRTEQRGDGVGNVQVSAFPRGPTTKGTVFLCCSLPFVVVPLMQLERDGEPRPAAGAAVGAERSWVEQEEAFEAELYATKLAGLVAALDKAVAEAEAEAEAGAGAGAAASNTAGAGRGRLAAPGGVLETRFGLRRLAKGSGGGSKPLAAPSAHARSAAPSSVSSPVAAPSAAGQRLCGIIRAEKIDRRLLKVI